MNTAFLWASCLLIIPFAVSVESNSSKMVDVRPRTTVKAEHARLNAELVRTRTLIPARKYEQAIPICRQGHADALKAGEYGLAARFLMNLGSIQFSMRQFDQALTSYRSAHKLATERGEAGVAAMLTANIAALYSQLGELDSAAEWLEASMSSVTGQDRERNLPSMQLLLAAIRARQNNLEAAMPLYTEAIRAADRAGNWALYATAWNRIGEEYLKRNQPALAEQPLLEAWRVRKLQRLPLESSLYNLARLKLASGDRVLAEVLLNRAIDLVQQNQGGLPTWELYLTRGRVREHHGRDVEAMADMRVAAALARAWQWSAPADEASRIGSEGVLLRQVYGTLVDAGNSFYQKTGDSRVMMEIADLAEENRAASLRQLISDPTRFRRQLPPAYWQTVEKLQRAEVAALRHPDPSADANLRALRAELVRIEAGLGPGMERSETGVIEKTRSRLDKDTAVLAFHLGEARSWLWAIDRQGAILYELPAADRIGAAIAAMTHSVRDGDPSWKVPASHLYDMLFGALHQRFRDRSRWLVAPDGKLFEAPFSALVKNHGGNRVALAEQHSILIIPNLSVIVRRAQEVAQLDGPFVGVGDAIYNGADPRHFTKAPTLNLPRLVGSSFEIESCRRVWGHDESILFTGSNVSRRNLLEALAKRPSVLHIAAHVIPSSQRPSQQLIALSPGEEGPDLLAPYEIARWNAPVGLVVMSGCSSGSGAALPGTGLLGLTRAWLAAGAHNTLASRWAVQDDSGGVFEPFYRHLRADGVGHPALALQKAQKEMIRAGGRLAHPRHWGAYFVVGRPERKGGV